MTDQQQESFPYKDRLCDRLDVLNNFRNGFNLPSPFLVLNNFPNGFNLCISVSRPEQLSKWVQLAHIRFLMSRVSRPQGEVSIAL